MLILPQCATFFCVITVSYSTADSFCPVPCLNIQKCNEFPTWEHTVPNNIFFYVLAPCQSSVLNFPIAPLILNISNLKHQIKSVPPEKPSSIPEVSSAPDEVQPFISHTIFAETHWNTVSPNLYLVLYIVLEALQRMLLWRFWSSIPCPTAYTLPPELLSPLFCLWYPPGLYPTNMS